MSTANAVRWTSRAAGWQRAALVSATLAAALLVQRALGGQAVLVLLACAAVLLVAAVALRPLVGVLSLPVLNSLRDVFTLAPNLTPSVPVAVATVGAIVVQRTLRREPLLQRAALHLPVAALVIFCAALVPLQFGGGAEGLNYVRGFLSMGVFYFLFAAGPQSPGHIRLVAFASLAGIAAPTAAAVYHVATLGVLGAAIRSRALVENANMAAFFLASGLPFALAALLMARSRRGRAAWGVGVTLVVAAIIATLSRTGLTVLLLTSALTVALATGSVRRVVAVGAAVTLVGGLVALLFTRLPGALSDALTLLGRKPSERVVLARIGMRMIADHPLSGVGPDQFRFNFVRYLSPSEFPTAREYYETHIGMSVFEVDVPPHNAYVQAFAEEGLIAGTLFVGIVGAAVGNAYRAWRASRRRGDRQETCLSAALLAAVVGMALFMFTLDIFTDKLVWQLVGMTVAFRRVAERGAPVARGAGG